MDKVFPRFLSQSRIDPGQYRFFVVLNHCAALGFVVHALLVPVFAWLGIGVMASFNVASAILWSSALFLNRHGHHQIALAIVLGEVLVHSTLAVAEIGWGSGFQYYLFLAPPMLFFSPLATRLKIPLLVVTCASLVGLQAYDRLYSPAHVLSSEVLALLSGGNLATSFVVLAAVSYYYHRIATAAESAQQRTHTELARLAGTDELTGLINRRKMVDELNREADRFMRSFKPFAVLVADLDDFKSINDHLGHEAGDYVLKQVANTMSRATRQVDRLARWGGEEFLLLLPETDHEGALHVAEKIRDAVARQSVSYNDHTLTPTLTIGVAVVQPDEAVDRCILRADHALYRGKKEGKNRVIPA